MSIFRKTAATCLGALLAGVGLSSCGSTGASNDQGTSFLALGYFQLANPDEDDLELVGSNTFSVPLNTANPTARGGAASYFLWMGLENRLSTQFIRVTRIDCSYFIPGADPSLAMPVNSTVANGVISPAVFDDEDNVPRIPQPNEELIGNDDFPGKGQIYYVPFDFVPSNILAFVNNNINSLPQLPFTMNVTCNAVGVTQSGKVLETNSVSNAVLFYLSGDSFNSALDSSEEDELSSLEDDEEGSGSTRVNVEVTVDDKPTWETVE